MAPDNQGDTKPDQKPPPGGQTHPPDYGQTVSIGHVVEMLMQMQATLGELKSDAGHLKSQIEGFGRRLTRIEIMAWCAVGGIAVLIAVAGIILRPLISALVERILSGGTP